MHFKQYTNSIKISERQLVNTFKYLQWIQAMQIANSIAIAIAIAIAIVIVGYIN